MSGEKKETMKDEKMLRRDDCWGCRIVGGGGLLGASMWLWTSSRRFKEVGKTGDRRATAALALVAGALGLVRLLTPQEYLMGAISTHRNE